MDRHVSPLFSLVWNRHGMFYIQIIVSCVAQNCKMEKQHVKHTKVDSFVKTGMVSITTIKKAWKSTAYPDGLDARKRAWLPEQAYGRSTLQKKRTSVYQKAETRRTRGSGLSCCFTPLEQRNPSEPPALTHHGTSPNSGMYLLGKFSRGTPKIFAPLMKSLSFLPSKLFTVIP